jgi:hypothetical protein
MGLFRKNPVVIEARQLTEDTDPYTLAGWCGGIVVPNGIRIHTLEGDHLAEYGDYIIKGVKGEFYPCKSDIFHLTYEEVHD